MTYSFPCQDLSVAGKGKGMLKGSNTRSGLLWEVERLLNEVEELPQILIMENVPLVHGEDNREAFNEWCSCLESKGYKNYWKDLLASDYGVPQSRKRTFMVSLLGNYRYEFLTPPYIKTSLRYIMEQEVDSKYYLSIEELERVSKWNTFKKPLKDIKFEFDICPTLIARDNGVYQLETSHSSIIYDRKGLRLLTSVEKARLMGFADDIVEKVLNAGVSERQLQKQLGNGIVVNCLEYVFKGLI